MLLFQSIFPISMQTDTISKKNLFMEILKSPWKKTLIDLVKNSKKSIKITSPYVKENICIDIFNVKRKDVSFELITSFKLGNAHSGALDLAGLDLIIRNNGTVKSHSKLHSKIYLFDNSHAIITSGNLTNGGLIANFEYGVLINDKNTIKTINNDFDLLSSNEMTNLVEQEHIFQATEILNNFSKVSSNPIPKWNFSTSEVTLGTVDRELVEVIFSTLKGWKLSVFQCIDAIDKHLFSLNDVYAYEQELQGIYPHNHNIKAKIRQQLQYLRDLGLLEFIKIGYYRKLWT